MFMGMFTYPQVSITSLDMVYQIGHTKEILVDLKKVDVKERRVTWYWSSKSA
jgi:hypothetical protein